MENGILDSTKKTLGLGPEYTPFDHDIITHINAAFAVLYQLGIGPETPFAITDQSDLWDDFDCPAEQKNMVKTYVYLKVRIVFDPPGTSFHLEAMNNQIKEYEWRISELKEVAEWEASQIV